MTGPELEIYWEIKRSNISKYMTDFNMFSGESNDEKLLIAGHEKLKKEVERYLQKLS